MKQVLEKLEEIVQAQAEALRNEDTEGFIAKVEAMEHELQNMEAKKELGIVMNEEEQKQLASILAIMQFNQKNFQEEMRKVQEQLRMIRQNKRHTVKYNDGYGGYSSSQFEG